jgi:hypothetical protein
MRKKLALIAALVALLVVGIAAAFYVRSRDAPEGELDTELAGVSVVIPAVT